MRMSNTEFVGANLLYDPLTYAEVMTPESYEKNRRLFLTMGRRQKMERRIRLNAHLSLLFETRFTVWLQIQEELRWHAEPNHNRAAKILKANNPLIAPMNELRACLFIDSSDPRTTMSIGEDLTIQQLNLRLTLNQKVFVASATESHQDHLDPVSFIRFRPSGCEHQSDDCLRWGKPVPSQCALPSRMAKILSGDLDDN